MSTEYNNYLNEHIANVNKALIWMADNLSISELGLNHNALSQAIDEAHHHDESKYSDREYGAYDAYFYGGNRSFKVVQDFNYAWLHHIHHNPHHWQYWVLFEDDPKGGKPYKALEMPHNYILEMIADWWTFSWKAGDLGEIFKWYADHKEKMVLGDKTRKLVEKVLDKMRDILTEQGEIKEEVVEHSGVKGQKWGERNGPPYPLKSNNMAEKIFSDAQKKSTVITPDVEAAARQAGGKMHGLENKLKTVESINRKLNKKISEKGMSLTDAANSIKDASRYTVISSTDEFVNTYNKFKLNMEKKGYTETSCDNYFDKFNKGEVKHKAVQSNFADKDGYEFEVQFHTPESQDAKDKKLPLYNERRKIDISDSRAKELERQMEDLALKVPDPIGIETIQSHDAHLKHTDISEEDKEKKFGVPEQKKFPLPDADHVKSAIRFFNYVDPKYEKELAEAILDRMKEYGIVLGEDISVGDENRFKKYIPEEEKNNE